MKNPNPFAPLTDSERSELHYFLAFEVDADEVMMIDMLDGFLHAIAAGPTTIHPKRWSPEVWGLGTFCLPWNQSNA